MRLATDLLNDAPALDSPAIVWEECACLLCGSTGVNPLLEAADALGGSAGLSFLIVRCHRCGLCYTNPRPDAVSIRRFYSPERSFDTIELADSLPQMHEPLTALHNAYRLLPVGAKMRITVPNFASLSACWFGPDWHALDLPRHLTHFTPETLRSMLGRAGFVEITIRQRSRPDWIRQSARLSQQRHGATQRTRFLQTRLGSAFFAAWGRLCRSAECLSATATRR
jgi:hypothetical protein